MLETTLGRLDGLIPKERRVIVTHVDQVDSTKQIAQGACDHFLAEPEARDTANALAMASLYIKKIAGKDALLVSLHADAVITRVDVFRETVQQLLNNARNGYISLLGVLPLYPETGYGYIEKGKEIHGGHALHVASFREKPDLETAEFYLASGNYCWNAGIFAWKNSVLIDELSLRLPNSIQLLNSYFESSDSSRDFNALKYIYNKLPKISIDHAVLEVSDNIAVIEADIGWQDIGSWDALSRCFDTDSEGNLFYGDVLAIDTKNTTVDTDGAFVACVGLEDVAVVSSKGAILVCPKGRAQEVKSVVARLKDQGRSELL